MCQAGEHSAPSYRIQGPGPAVHPLQEPWCTLHGAPSTAAPSCPQHSPPLLLPSNRSPFPSPPIQTPEPGPSMLQPELYTLTLHFLLCTWVQFTLYLLNMSLIHRPIYCNSSPTTVVSSLHSCSIPETMGKLVLVNLLSNLTSSNTQFLSCLKLLTATLPHSLLHSNIH